ncbi:hypothetical protein BFG57_06735 [Bacillus solimangrovi]|uniref:Uncharacterized protein n=2 Tax=Bacillus solimangrovi TaxID=1305675 RepID=A0A1E5LAE0_9BACI|nr:hypothetical protein BFG57_06735 [Bacillus solimangrovi]
MEYLNEDIIRVDELNSVKNGGDTTIRTVYGRTNKPLEIRFHVQDGELKSFNAFPGHSKRDVDNLIWSASQ